ncbi:MAG: thioredoxin fold domain-containing protein [Bacteroidia bacterium]|jgi:thioredoxin-related protein|nr:thioredoxin fold domain-containing protein [Bacteroidia bacterium]
MKKLSLLLLLGIIACGKKPMNTSFRKLIKAKEYTVLMFIAPDCPMCKTLSTPFSKLIDEYPNVQFLMVHSGMHYDPMEINMFATETKIKNHIFRDYNYEVATQLGATVTPEFFLIDSAANPIYSGLLDDRLLTLGNYKQQWNKHYLKEALDAILDGKKPELTKTNAVGCVLEY